MLWLLVHLLLLDVSIEIITVTIGTTDDHLNIYLYND